MRCAASQRAASSTTTPADAAAPDDELSAVDAATLKDCSRACSRVTTGRGTSEAITVRASTLLVWDETFRAALKEVSGRWGYRPLWALGVLEV